MKGLNINVSSSCTSQNSTAILSSTMDLASSSPSSPTTSSSPFSTFTTGSRAIDRHNPIITDERRSGGNSSCTSTPIRTPCTNNVLQHKPTTPKPHHQITPKKKGNKLATLTKKTTSSTTTTSNKNANPAEKPPFSPSNNHISDIMIDGDDDSSSGGRRRSFSKPSDPMMMMKAAEFSKSKPGVEYISPPPESSSSRYLLDDTSFLQVLSDFDPVLKLVPFDDSKSINNNDNNKNVEEDDHHNKPHQGSTPVKPSSCSGTSDHQVVVLRVSLHCRGCEKKMKKHLSRMAGVTSFNIDFAAKKVTVVGDVTPLGVLASISKVKTAKLWTPASISSSSSSSSSQLNSRNMTYAA